VLNRLALCGFYVAVFALIALLWLGINWSFAVVAGYVPLQNIAVFIGACYLLARVADGCERILTGEL
jgi:hypothetical protein